ncbi:hypothetical protein [Hyphomonas sp.]|uniref:hypothetical protein n=1 Tax=Hyphomonas sp. TaxID=87 RepID=UPI00391C3563
MADWQGSCEGCGLKVFGGTCPDGVSPALWRQCGALRSRVYTAAVIWSEERRDPHPDTVALLQRLNITRQDAELLLADHARYRDAVREIEGYIGTEAQRSIAGILVNGQSPDVFCRNDPMRMAAFVEAAIGSLNLVDGQRNMSEIWAAAAEISRKAEEALGELGAPDVEMDCG